MAALADHVERAGLAAGTPVAVACLRNGAALEVHAAGTWPSGRAAVAADRFYVASLAKQVTGAALALLVRDGIVDPDLPVSRWLGDLPGWVGAVTPRQLAHHVAGMPLAGDLESKLDGRNWTEAFALAALDDLKPDPAPPAARHAYSNVGYILLGRLIASATGQSLADFVEARMFRPHGLRGIHFERHVSGEPQIGLMGLSLPLSHGDGGLWSTAADFARWLQLLNADTLRIAGLVEVAGRLADGTRVDYGWGIGLREFRGHRLFIHGGEWKGAVAKAVRCPALGLGIIAMAAGAPFETLDALVASLLNAA